MRTRNTWLVLTTMAALASSQPLECTATERRDMCTLSLVTDLQGQKRSIGLWDSECHKIGGAGTDDKWEPLEGRWSIGGRGLNWTVELVIDREGTPERPNGGFWYGGKWSYLDQGRQFDCLDEDLATACTHVQFKCRGI